MLGGMSLCSSYSVKSTVSSGGGDSGSLVLSFFWDRPVNVGFFKYCSRDIVDDCSKDLRDQVTVALVS